MNIETLYYKLTGTERPKHLKLRERLIIDKCLEIINQTEQSHKHVIVRGGDIETKSVHDDVLFIKDIEVKVTPNTPTEPLATEEGTQSPRGRCEWCGGAKYNQTGLCGQCGRFPPIARSSHEGAAVGDGAAGQNVREGNYDTYKKGDELYGG